MNRILVDFLDLPTPFRNNGWLDVRMRAEGIEFFWNLNPYTLTTETPYLTVAWDLQHRRQPFFPEVSVDGRFERWTRRFDTLFKRATYVITGTETGRKELELFYQLGEDRVRVIPQPTPSFALSAQVEEIDVLARHKLPARFLYYPAQFWPHKNHVTLLEALNLVRAGGVDIDLVLCGTDQGNLEHVKQSVVRLELTGHVHFLGFVTREELIALYRRAQALTYVSLFGPDNLPPLEAFALGCPVIASRVPGSEEQLGGTALLFEPTDAAALASAIRHWQRGAYRQSRRRAPG